MRTGVLLSLFFFSHLASGKGRVLKVAASDISPYVTEKGEERGYFYEIVTKAFADAGYELDIQFFPPLRARKIVESGERDVLIPCIQGRHDEDKFVFSKALNGSTIGTIRFKDAPPLHEEKPLSAALSLDTLEAQEKTLQLIDMLNQKRFDSIIADKLIAADVLVNKRPHLVGKLEFSSPPLRHVDFHVAFAKNNPRSLQRLSDFNLALDNLKKNGIYQKILTRYGLRDKVEGENTLVVGAVANADMKLLEELSPVFLKKHPNVSIQWNSLEENLLRKRIVSSIALHEQAFDVISVGHNEALVFAKRGWIEPLEKPRKDYDLDDLLPVVRNDMNWEGQLYALPFYREATITYFRTDLFAKKGLTMPAQPTLAEIRDFAAKLHDPEAGIHGICLRGKAGWGENTMTISDIVKAFGGQWFGERWKPILTSREWHDGVSYYMDLQRRFGVPNAYQNGYAESLQLFAEGRCAIWVDATVAASFLSDRKNSKVFDRFGFAMAPKAVRDYGANRNWTWSFAIPKPSRKKALAQEFMEWATSKEYLELVAAKRGWLVTPPGTRASTYQNENYRKAAPFGDFVLDIILGRHLPAQAEASKADLVELNLPEFPALGNVLGSNMSDVLKNKRTIAEALSLAQRDIKRIMYHSGYYSVPDGL